MNVKEYSVNELIPGMIIAAPVITNAGQILLDVGVTLTRPLIEKIAFYQIPSVTIEVVTGTEEKEPEKKEPEAKETAEKKADFFTQNSLLHYEQKTSTNGTSQSAEPSYSQKVKKSAAFQKFQVDFSFSANDLKNIFDSIVAGGAIDIKDMLKKVTSLLKPEQTTIDFFDMLHNLRSVNDSIYAHCINVSLISRMIGIWLKLPQADIDTLTIAGLLHDIGKTQIPDDILNKKERLTDEEFALIRKHPVFGYDILKKHDLDVRILKATLMHHERCDGSGYPLALKEGDIDDFALIVAIADVYDAMTAARIYRAPLCPFEVIAEFEKEGLQKYKPKYILTFLEHIATTYQNNRVMLSNGESAKIVLLNQQVFSKPLVQLTDGSCIDLNRSPLYIKAII